MTVFFDSDKLKKYANGDLRQYIYLFQLHCENKLLPRNIRGSLVGRSFLLNPISFLKDKQTDILFKIQYIELAARRDYSLYKLYGYKSLDTSFYPDLNIPKIQNNPLLQLDNRHINFKYEEINGNKF